MLSLVPPTEGPADIDTAFQTIGVELAEQEARQNAEADAASERLRTPDRAAVDELRASYEACY
jgi:hypothetical protein